MEGINIYISSYYSKSFDNLSRLFKENLHLVITLCKEEICPILPKNIEHIHLPFNDLDNISCSASEEQLFNFRKIRDEIKENLLLIV